MLFRTCHMVSLRTWTSSTWGEVLDQHFCPTLSFKESLDWPTTVLSFWCSVSGGRALHRGRGRFSQHQARQAGSHVYHCLDYGKVSERSCHLLMALTSGAKMQLQYHKPRWKCKRSGWEEGNILDSTEDEGHNNLHVRTCSWSGNPSLAWKWIDWWDEGQSLG